MNVIILESRKIATSKIINSPDKVTEVKLTSHLHLVSRLSMTAAVHIAWTRTK